MNSKEINELTLILHSLMKTYNLLNYKLNDSYIVLKINSILEDYFKEGEK